MSDGALVDHNPGAGAGELPGNTADGVDRRDEVDGLVITSSSSSSVAEGLNSLISSEITGFDFRAEATSRSQDQLSSALDRLTGELDKLLEDAPSTFIMQHSTRISGVRKRVKALNSVLKSIQRRIDNMDRLMSAGLMHDNRERIGDFGSACFRFIIRCSCASSILRNQCYICKLKKGYSFMKHSC